ncbi:hypothetical protein ABT093_19655 [Kitasatospora sp. NPDC002551]|uniref:hypothetical protein n=1 Tax=Kitasatospora sp. NPDC002551 TaxID=3154539 RepID=UPI0033281D80
MSARRYTCQTITGPGRRRCGSPPTRRLTCTFDDRTEHYLLCGAHCGETRRWFAQPWVKVGCNGTSEVLISQHLPFVGAFCAGALDQASRPPAPLGRPGAAGRRPAGTPGLTPESLPPDHANHLLAVVMGFVDGYPPLAARGLDAEAAGRAWWVGVHDPQALEHLDPETRQAVPAALLQHIAEAAPYGNHLFHRVEHDKAGNAYGVYPDRTPPAGTPA